MIKRILFSILLLTLVAGCGGYIKPQPQFVWPEMASSQIVGSLGIYLDKDKLHLSYNSPAGDDCCKHRAVKVGDGLLEAARQSGEAVFNKTIVLKGEPTDTYIKSLDLRGLLHLNDAYFNVEFIPYVDKNHGAEKIYLYHIKVSLDMKLTAIDFQLSDIRGITIEAGAQSNEPVPRHRVNKVMQKLVNELFSTAADNLARELVTAYGARA
jgi:hypothetical protein